MPDVSQPHAEIQVVPSRDAYTADLELLEEKIQLAVEAISELKQERDSLHSALENAKAKIKALQGSKKSSDPQGAELTQLTSERDRLLQDRHNTTRRVEAMLNRLKALGFE